MARFLSLKSYLAKWNLQSPHCSSTKYNVIFKISKFESKSGHCIMCLRILKIFLPFPVAAPHYYALCIINVISSSDI